MAQHRANAALQRLSGEADRLQEIKVRSSRPAGCGPEIIDIAPARGPVRAFQPREVVMTDSGQVRVARSGHNGYDALQRADAFDLMMLRGKGRASADATPMFTAGQISAGRDYAALYERCQSAGVRCSSVEALGGGGQGSYIDAVMRDSGRLAALDRAVGTEVVLSSRGAQAHADRGRKIVRASDLVHGVCVGGLTIGQVLRKFGWPVTTVVRTRTRFALCACLNRMQGFAD